MTPTTTTADDALVHAAQSGDRQALAALLERHAPRVARFAGRMCQDPHEAEDVMQDTLLAAVRTLPGFRGDSSVSTWLFAIARSYCIKKRRRGRSVTRADASFDDETSAEIRGLGDALPPADERLGDRELAQTLDRAIAHLPTAQREVLLLRDVEGLTAPEVASVLGLGVDAVKSRLHRARLAVRAEVAPLLAPDAADLTPAPGAMCPDVLTKYSRHLEGDISTAVCADLERHLAGCPRCQGVCDTLRRTLAMCRASAGPAVPPSTQMMVRQALGRVLAQVR